MIETEWNVSLKDKELGLVLILMMVTKIQDLKLSRVVQKYCEIVLENCLVNCNYLDTVLHFGDQLMSSIRRWSNTLLEMKERGLALRVLLYSCLDQNYLILDEMDIYT